MVEAVSPKYLRGLRTFVIVGLSAIVPLLLQGLIFGYKASTRERQVAETQVSIQIDGAADRLDSILVAQSAAAIEVAGFRSLGQGDYPKLYEHLQLMPQRHPEWLNLLVADENGERLIDLRAPLGRLLPPLDLSALPAGGALGRVAIGGIAPPGLYAKGRSIPIFIPARGKDDRHLVVVLALAPELIENVLAGAGLPADWRGAVLDADGMVVGRTANSPFALGEKPSDGRRDGVGKVFSINAKIQAAGWTMACEIPLAILDKPVDDAKWLMMVLGAGSLGLAVLLASLVARDVGERRQLELGTAERRLQVSEAWRLMAVDAAAIGTWHWDAEEGRLQGCERCRQLLGEAGFPRNLRGLLRSLFPEDGKALLRAAREGRGFEREFRLRLPGGSEHWLQIYGRPLKDPDGKAIGTYGVLVDIDEQKRAEAEHRILVGRLHSAQEEERLRIARDLHDRVGQSITGLSLAVKRLEAAEKTEERRARYIILKEMIGEISRDVHRAALELRPTALDDFGLSGAIETYLREWTSRTGLQVESGFAGLAGPRMPALVETTAYRITVELLTNIARHAEASEVGLTLTRRDGTLTLVVEDNGRGMGAAPNDRLGLRGVKERLELVGGEMQIESGEGAGTSVFVRIPLGAEKRKEEAA